MFCVRRPARWQRGATQCHRTRQTVVVTKPTPRNGGGCAAHVPTIRHGAHARYCSTVRSTPRHRLTRLPRSADRTAARSVDHVQGDLVSAALCGLYHTYTDPSTCTCGRDQARRTQHVYGSQVLGRRLVAAATCGCAVARCSLLVPAQHQVGRSRASLACAHWRVEPRGWLA